MSDHAERLRTFCLEWRAHRMDIVNGAALDELVEVLEPVLDELEQARADQRPALGNAYAAGWTDVVAGFRTPGWAEREAGWKRFLGDPHAVSAPQQPELEPRLPDRLAKLLAAVQREGGDWSPLRARGEMVRCGYAVTSERAHQIMKQLAERGYLEQVRPRAYTYRLKAEVPQQPERSADADGAR